MKGTPNCEDKVTQPSEGGDLFAPVYHALAKGNQANEREVIELPLVQNNGRYEMDFDSYDAALPAHAKMVILCSPHNPGARVWSPAELQQVAKFCVKHDLILVSDEIHHDLTFGLKHTPMALIDGISDRLIMMTAASKTFNIAGGHSGNVIIEDPSLRARFAKRMQALGLSPNAFGLHMITAAYSPEGAQWVDDLLAYIDENRKIFDAGINAIPGLTSMPLEATYLAWVDVSGTGMPLEEAIDRVQKRAKIAVNHGPTFGKGGESFLRFNIGTQRANVERAVAAMQAAF